jgi:SAM-dependent methyltransferase
MDSGIRLLREETERLRWAWDRHPAEWLDGYLVSGAEDPRINMQSILTRALIADTLFPGRFDALVDAEWRFGLCNLWMLDCLQRGIDRSEITIRIESGDAARCPRFVTDTAEYLRRADCPLPDYIGEALLNPEPDGDARIPDSALDTFSSIWTQTLASCPDTRLSIVEPACGSANDYRYLARYGFARFLRYTGFDLSRKNVQNARRRFPDVPFFAGNVFQIPAPDAAFEYLSVHDLFEHLSPEGLDRALDEVLRVTGREAWLSFFNLAEIPEHRFHASGGYHWNTLSQAQILQSVSRRSSGVSVVDIAALANEKFGFGQYYNPHAKTLIVGV